MYCHSCGQELFSGACFCQKCGTKVAVEKSYASNALESPVEWDKWGPFFSATEIASWRRIGLLPDMDINPKFKIESLEKNEEALFALFHAADIGGPRTAIRNVKVWRVELQCGEAKTMRVKYSSHPAVFVTDRRFLIYEMVGFLKYGMIYEIPYVDIETVEYSDYTFSFHLRQKGKLAVKYLAAKYPPSSPVNSNNASEYVDSLLTRMKDEDLVGFPKSIELPLKVPKAGLLDVMAILGGKTTIDSYASYSFAESKNAEGNSIMSVLYDFFYSIQDKNKMMRSNN